MPEGGVMNQGLAAAVQESLHPGGRFGGGCAGGKGEAHSRSSFFVRLGIVD